MNENNIMTFDFENRPLTVINYNGRPAFIASEVGVRLGYDQITKHISQDWTDEFEEGRDYTVVAGQELSDLKVLLKDNPDFGLSRTARVTLLFESGVNIIALLSRKPEARRLRRFLAAEVMPQLARDGRFAPDRTVVDGKLHSRTTDREQRLLQKEERLARRMKVEGLKRLSSMMREHGRLYSEESIACIEIKLAEASTGEKFTHLLPQITEEWKSPTQIGEEHGMSGNAVGLVITKLGLRGDPQYSRKVQNKSRYSNREVESFLYNTEAIRLIENHIGGQQDA